MKNNYNVHANNSNNNKMDVCADRYICMSLWYDDGKYIQIVRTYNHDEVVGSHIVQLIDSLVSHLPHSSVRLESNVLCWIFGIWF